MAWLAALLGRVGELGPWGLIPFALLYVAAAVMMAPAFLLSVAAGALFGVWKGSLLVFVSATLGATAAYGVARMLAGTRVVAWIMRDRRGAGVGPAGGAGGGGGEVLPPPPPPVPPARLEP